MRFVRGVGTKAMVAGALALGLAACGGGGGSGTFQTQSDPGGGFKLFGGGGQKAPPQATIGVNAYLWSATLATLSFMPLVSADPYGGTVITDWYVNPEQPNERLKVTVYILDARLRADGLNVSVFKQVRDAAGGWTDAPTAAQTETDLENAILTKARQLRLSNIRG
ncbi:MAG: DUF3576 domain-containing protein [Phenylobacterium sp.]